MFFNIKPLEFGAPGRIRTRDPLVRSQVLYPTELPARERGIMQNNSSFVNDCFSNGGEGGIRTPEARFMSLHPYQGCAFSHSATSPHIVAPLITRSLHFIGKKKTFQGFFKES